MVYVIGYNSSISIACWILSLSLIATSLNESFEGILTGYERLQEVGYTWAVEILLRVSISVFLLYHGFGLLALVGVYVLLRYITCIFYLLYLFRYLGVHKFQINLDFCKNIIRLARTFALITFFVTIYWKADIIMLSKLKGVQEVGVYSAAYRFFGLIAMAISNFVLALFPVISEFFQSDKNAFEKICKITVKYFIMLALPGVILLIFYADKLILLIYGENFNSAIPVLKILAIAIIPYGISEIFAHMLIASSKQKIDLLINGFGMIVNITLNFILIPYFGYLGAAFGTLISIFIYLSVQFPFIANRLLKVKLKNVLKFALIMVVSPAVMIGVILILRSVDLLEFSFISVLVYFGLIWMLKAISEKEKGLLLQLLKRD